MLNRRLKWGIGLGVLAALVLGLWLQAGIVEDPEWGEYSIFWKAHPTFKVWFRSPLGMTDMEISELEPEAQQAERDYRRYVLGE